MDKYSDIVVFCHLFYEDSWAGLKNDLLPLTDHNHRVFINICSDMPYCEKLESQIRKDRPEFVVIKNANKGRDIGGKLKCLQHYLEESYSSKYMIVLHDKKNPNRAFLGGLWKSSLFKIVRRRFIVRILNMFKDKELGMVGSERMFCKHLATNYESICTLCGWYGLPIYEKDDIEFIMGTMFWVRSSIFEKFFKENSVGDMWEELEDGDTDDMVLSSFTHSWERLFALIVRAQNYKMVGV